MLKDDVVKKIDVERLKLKVNRLDSQQKRDLINYLKSSYSIFDEHVKITACPHCGSSHIVKNGTRNGHHKYVCKNCKKNFTYRTNTVLSGIQKLNKWNEFVEDFMSLNISPLKDLVFRLKVSEQTIFNWRHKLLSVLVTKEPKFVNEVVEFDEAWFLISRKGRQNMDITNRWAYRSWRRSQRGDTPYWAKVFFTYGRTTKNLDVHLSNMGRVRKRHLQPYFTPAMFNNVTMFTDKHPAYKGFFADNNIRHETFTGSHHYNYEKKQVHVQTVNKFIAEFRGFSNYHLRGVSTKYLNNYLKWYQFLYATKTFVNKQLAYNDKKIRFNILDKICEEVVTDSTGLGLYRQLEVSYETFLKQNKRTDYGECKNHYYSDKMAC